MPNSNLRIAMSGLALLTGLAASTSVLAQNRPTDLVGATDISGVPIDLLPPGARALGLGGAFGAVADDATAAVANPAGLTILSSSEFSIHYRDSDFDIDFVDVDAYNSAFFADSGQLTKNYSDSGSDISFASYVKPFERFTISAYYLNQVSLEAFSTPETVVDNTFFDTFLNVNEIAAEIEGFGFGVGYRVNDLISVGVTIQRTELDVRSFDFWGVEDFFDGEFFLSDLSCTVGDTFNVPCEGADVYAPILDDFRGFGTLVDGDDDDVTYNVGILFNPNGRWSFGIVYRKGAEFEFNPNQVSASRFGCTGSGPQSDFCTTFLGTSSGSMSTDPIITPNGTLAVTEINVPDTLTFGVAWRPSETLLIALDINDIDYGSLNQIRPTTLGFGLDVNDQSFRPNLTDPDLANLNGPITERIGDGISYHLGVEKVFPLSGDFLSMYTLTVRGGAFTDDDHDGNALVDGDDTHGVFGLGATFGDHIQIDLAAEFSDRVDNFVLSAIYRF